MTTWTKLIPTGISSGTISGSLLLESSSYLLQEDEYQTLLESTGQVSPWTQVSPTSASWSVSTPS